MNGNVIFDCFLSSLLVLFYCAYTHSGSPLNVLYSLRIEEAAQVIGESNSRLKENKASLQINIVHQSIDKP